MSDPCPYKCANPDCSYRRSLDESEADDELARLRAENERLQRAVAQAIDILEKFEFRTATAWPSTGSVIKLLREAQGEREG